jgi:hypothetical protein
MVLDQAAEAGSTVVNVSAVTVPEYPTRLSVLAAHETLMSERVIAPTVKLVALVLYAAPTVTVTDESHWVSAIDPAPSDRVPATPRLAARTVLETSPRMRPAKNHLGDGWRSSARPT